MLDLSSPKKIHIVGICGAGMSSIAVVLTQMGHTVSGSDQSPQDSVMEKLQELGVEVYSGHSSENILSNVELITYSSAILKENPELQHGTEQNIALCSRKEILSSICILKKTLAVAGSHGKTTTTAMLAGALKSINVSYLIGGELMNGSLGGHWDEKGEWLIVEADESDATFIELPVNLGLVTSMDHDHTEHYGGSGNLEVAYQDFISSAKDSEFGVIVQTDDSKLDSIFQELNTPKCLSVGSSARNVNFSFQDCEDISDGARANILHSVPNEKPKKYKLEIPVPGTHNIANATMAFAASVCLGVPPKNVLVDLKTFEKVKRRFEILGKAQDITFIDDYAHTPQEIAATLKTAKQKTKLKRNRVVCAFQPHRYSRTENLWESYADAFDDCEVLIISEIYSAGEQKRDGISGKLIMNAVLGSNPRKKIAWIPEKDDLPDYLNTCLRAGDVFITLNAGDLYQVGKKIYSNFNNATN